MYYGSPQTNGSVSEIPKIPEIKEIPKIPTLGALHEVGWQHDLIRIIDGEFASQRGRLISGYLAYSGLVDKPLAFLADYEANRAGVDLYLSHIDLHGAVNGGGGGGPGFGFVGGVLLGIAAAFLVVKLRET